MRLTIKEREESMATGKAFDGKPYAGNPHVRFDEGEVAPAATPRRGSLLYKTVFVNGSPHVNVNTARASEEVASARRAADALAREPWQMTNFVR